MEPVNHRAGIAHRSRIHPLVATAAGAVIVACGVGVAAMTGVLPRAGGQTPAPGTPTAAQVAQSGSTAPTGQVLPNATAPAVSAAPPVQQVAQNAPPPAPVAPAICHTCGVVTSVNAYRVQGHGTGIGAVGGAVAGGLVGQAFGGGHGRIATTLLGAAGGGYAGNAIERNVRSTTNYRVTVKMQDGTYHTFRYASTPPVNQGERVRVENGVLRAG
ncbi:glycine zipper 2TM domain-containing protein [Robbsia sp. KACC 23696]|uniref:glycine zipper 2TM domain-containing protein n=1 Tax=Robbsia sp. KACC 23696 TaxID=3149231 RepID=UPI00325A70D7